MSALPATTSSAPPPLRRLGRSGLVVSAIGLGCNNLGRSNTVTATREGVQALIDAALDAGVTFFDVADNYGARPGLAEEALGRALGSRRDDVVVATKFGMSVGDLNGRDFDARGSRRYVVRAVEGSLRRLGTDRIDLYQLHTPDPLTPIDETLAALDDLVRAGKVRYVGHANRAGWQIADAEHVARALGTTRFVSTQNEYNLTSRLAEQEVLPAAQAYGLGVLPYYPLANGLLTGKYAHGARPDDGRLVHSKPDLLDRAPWEALARLHAFAEVRGLRDATVALGWLLARPQVASVIAGATTPEQVRQNVASAAWVPTPDDLAELDDVFPPARRVAPF
ncbi:aldo/keto reductase [Luteimicrobium subarcticum]|uniref:Aryl-alcohol dehydrogenase-like predicted oxidoreductase n=1 Tax=Luteimicrobium subarcticum TaxID=620910 RepID=A0A2M8WQM5_9MICO|nr:aldo/keto reductase [Luteimicrobium subarcticum]PJI93240.1 aryl-alcohol dehydrogenase-like predicted oxidoreductase [Luteimicrobium subarcticum]